MRTKYLLAATALLSAATASLTNEARADIVGSNVRTVGTGEISATIEQKGGVVDLFATRLGIASYNDLWVRTKLFSKNTELIHSYASASALHLRPGSSTYEEDATAYVFIDGKMVGPVRTTCYTRDTCSEATQNFEKTLGSVSKTYSVTGPISLTVTGSINAAAGITAYGRSHSSNGAMPMGKHHARTKATLDGQVSLGTKLSAQLNWDVATPKLYGTLNIFTFANNMAAKGNAENPYDGTGTESGYTTASQTLSTGSGSLGFNVTFCVACWVFPIGAAPFYVAFPGATSTTFDFPITNWGPVYSRTTTLWDKVLSI